MEVPLGILVFWARGSRKHPQETGLRISSDE